LATPWLILSDKFCLFSLSLSLSFFFGGGRVGGQIIGIFSSVNLTSFANFGGIFWDHRIGKKKACEFFIFSVCSRRRRCVCLCSTHPSLGVDYRIHINKMNNFLKNTWHSHKRVYLKIMFYMKSN
jgi:hypothetical protein